MSCLVVIDPQNDFCPGGALAVEGGDQIMPSINEMMAAHDVVVLTQDWHPQAIAALPRRIREKLR